MGSSRFPGKPMAKMLGITMIEHVYRRVALSKSLTTLVVATCDQEIVDHIEKIGGRAVMTSSRHERASDRCAEALMAVEKEDDEIFDLVVMVQGDEPMVYPEMIDEAISPMLDDASIVLTNLLGKIESHEEFEDRNCIKTVCDLKGDALYFSREPIPTASKEGFKPVGKQICIIPFRREFLLRYCDMPPTPLEIAESVDMMRVLENGFKVRMVPTLFNTKAVDTESDRQVVEKLLSNDRLYKELFPKAN
jgi:3-deoxy-manno-octulosonate cytidylyltransferase (CMP-KDO synthetase)